MAKIRFYFVAKGMVGTHATGWKRRSSGKNGTD
jgi:hypothetical protein